MLVVKRIAYVLGSEGGQGIGEYEDVEMVLIMNLEVRFDFVLLYLGFSQFILFFCRIDGFLFKLFRYYIIVTLLFFNFSNFKFRLEVLFLRNGYSGIMVGWGEIRVSVIRFSIFFMRIGVLFYLFQYFFSVLVQFSLMVGV